MMKKTINIINKSKYPLPEYETEDSAGMDLKANIDNPVFIYPFDRVLIPTGLFMELPTGTEFQIRPRSGLALKKGITVLNSPGTIDADYRGEVGVILCNLSNTTFKVEPGDRIAQGIFKEYLRAEWKEVEELSETERGSGGFGSTNNK